MTSASGQPGLSGIPGQDGPKGDLGRDGLNGVPGPKGYVGLDGLTGLEGQPGLKGDHGLPGLPGIEGGYSPDLPRLLVYPLDYWFFLTPSTGLLSGRTFLLVLKKLHFLYLKPN